MVNTERVLIRFRDKITKQLQYEIIEGSQSEIESTLLEYLSSKDAHSLMILGYAGQGIIDEDTGAQVIIPIPHYRVHQQVAYTVSDYDDDIDVAGPKYWRITTPESIEFHVKIAVECDAGAIIEFFENPTISGEGSALTAYNNDRNSTNTSIVTFFEDTTTSNDGTRLQVIRVGGSGFFTQFAGNARQNFEWILKKNEDYIIKVTPDADNLEATITIEGYEVTPIT